MPFPEAVRACSRTVAVAVAVLGAVLLAAPVPGQGGTAEKVPAQDEDESPARDVVRLLWTPGTVVSGKVEVEALPLDPDIRRLVFLLDGEEVGERSKPPWREKIRIAEPPRLQRLTVRALGPGERLLGEDEVEINRVRRPLRVRLDSLTEDLATGRVQVPLDAELAEVVAEVDGEVAGRAEDADFSIPLRPAAGKGQVVRVVARLRDGREIEDAALFGSNLDAAEVDVSLVQLQVLATAGNGRPIEGLGAGDFELREGREMRRIAQVRPAEDVSLLLGLVIDASESMRPIWPAVRSAADAFLTTVMEPRDEAFLVDFSDRVRMLQPPTDERRRLEEAMDGVEPGGLTALYDSIVFAALEFGHRPGRRALVVITDGADYGSQADPRRAVEISRKLGVPVYVVSIGGGDPRTGGGGRRAFARGGHTQEMKLITEPTGGRLLRTSGGRGGEGLLRAFRQIADELRSQYLLTYYTDQPLEDLDARRIEVLLPDRRDAEVRSVLAWDQVQ